MKIFVINGPNLNLLGTREPEIYGKQTLEEINNELVELFPECELVFFQSNCEGAIIDKLHEARGSSGGQAHDTVGVVLNAGAYTHYSYAISDAVAAIGVPVIEMHISDIYAREEFRRKSVLEPVCFDSVYGMGSSGYRVSIEILIREAKK